METTTKRNKGGRPKGLAKKSVEDADESAKFEALASRTYLTTQEAGEYIRFTPNYIRKLARERRIRHSRLPGGKILFLKEDLDQFVKMQICEVEKDVESQADTYLAKKALA